MTPIEKNIIVTDVNGKIIGSTFPKRAKGLVKQGRAEYTDDQTIRLKFTHAPAADKSTEENNMSKVIDFNARKFRFDETCVSTDGSPVNAGQRAFVTTSAGNAEVWEIGDWRWTWSQIRQDITLEPNTDYVFRVSVEGGVCDTNDMTTVAHIVPKDNWEERFSFLLDHDKFRPVICKKADGGLIRVFELPFSTGEYTEWTIFFAAQHAVTRFFAPVSAEALGNYSDTNYWYWWEHRGSKTSEGGKAPTEDDIARIVRENIGSLISSHPNITDIINKATGGAFDPAKFAEKFANGFSDLSEEDDEGDNLNLGISDREFDENGFAEFISKIGDCCNVALENLTVHKNSIGVVDRFEVGNMTDCTNIALSSCTLTSIALSMLIDKLGDSCQLAFEDVTVTPDGIDRMLDDGSKVDNTSVTLENVTIPQKAIDLIRKKLGADCRFDMNSVEVR